MKRYSAAIITSVIVAVGCTAKVNQVIYFQQNPVYGNTINTFGGRVPGVATEAELISSIHQMVSKDDLKFDSVAGYVTNFAYQKLLSFRFEDTARLNTEYGPLAFQLLQNSFLMPVAYNDLEYKLKKYPVQIYGLGDCTIYQINMTYKHIDVVHSPTSLYLIFPREHDASKLAVKSTALFTDSIVWQLINQGPQVVPILINSITSGRGRKTGDFLVAAPFEKEHGRFVPIVHLIKPIALDAH